MESKIGSMVSELDSLYSKLSVASGLTTSKKKSCESLAGDVRDYSLMLKGIGQYNKDARARIVSNVEKALPGYKDRAREFVRS